MDSDAYAKAGVHLGLGDDASKILFNASKLTWENRRGRFGSVEQAFDNFAGLRVVPLKGIPEDSVMNLSFDGIGTKTEVAERVGNHRTAAYDLFAMVCDDAVVRGGEPILVGSILDVRSLKKNENESHIDLVRQLAEGYVGAAKQARVAVVNGEVAELGARVHGYGDFNYNWGAGIAWFAQRKRLFTGKEIKPGDSIVALREEGFRSNGLSLVRRVLEEHLGSEWHKKSYSEGNIGDAILNPSRIYCAAVSDMFGGLAGEQRLEVHGVAHITGGGIAGKLGRVLKPSGLGASIDDPFEPSPIMQYVQGLGNVSDRVAYTTWNMGNGMLVITPNPDEAIKVAHEHGIDSKLAGTVIDETKGRILIKNRGQYRSSATDRLYFERE
ncbi:MAG: AIR synthase-related protein [Candidatus Pacearchaeota archaeon]